MQISDHYRPFEKKVVIAVTNNERARLLKAEGREVDEIEILETAEIAPVERSMSKHGQGEADFDAMKEHRLKELYALLSDRLREMLDHEGYTQAIVCVPEVNKNTFTENLAPDMQKKIAEVIPKNLASMDIPHIVRILLEG
ncbi:MAG: hypothetical protein QG626_463 [Patescibacteria group bacterium]|jgi:hypothetical protein|nr:hypothetical protein [Patescibacteria group bacterium]